jgi:hypothetical protein
LFDVMLEAISAEIIYYWQAAYEKMREEAVLSADETARDELGKEFELTKESLSTQEGLTARLELEELLDAAIDEQIKRLRTLRRLKRNQY